MSDLAKSDWFNRLDGFRALRQWPEHNSVEGKKETEELRRMAIEERADALGEAVSEADEFISKFLHLMSATAITHPATARMLIVADALTALITMHYKVHFDRPRPTQVVPGLLTPIQHGGHASYPSGHATQAHVFAKLLTAIIPRNLGDPPTATGSRPTVEKSLVALAKRIARNREIIGLHYPSDTTAGETLAGKIIEKILLASPPYLEKFANLVEAARNEWKGVYMGEMAG